MVEFSDQRANSTQCVRSSVRIKFVRAAAAFLFSIFPSLPLSADGTPPMAQGADLSDQAKLSILLETIQQAVNNPSDFNLYSIRGCVEKGQADEFVSTISNLARSLGNDRYISEASNGLPTFSIRSHEFRESGGGPVVDVEIRNAIGPSVLSIDARFQLIRHPGWFTLDLSSESRASIADFTNLAHEAGVASTRAKQPALATQQQHTDFNFSGKLMYRRNFSEAQEVNGYSLSAIGRLSTVTMTSEFGSVIVNRPFSPLAVSMDEIGSDFIDRDFLIISDPNWMRVVLSERHRENGSGDVLGWLKAFGQFGTGPGDFKQPMGIAHLPYNRFYVADCYNNRIVKYEFNEDGVSPGYPRALDSIFSGIPMNIVVDVATCIDGVFDIEFYRFHELVAALDKGHDRVCVYDGIGLPYKTLFSSGSGNNQISSPTSICFARDRNTAYNIPYIYVADAGNRRIVMRLVDDNTGMSFKATTAAFPQNCWFTSVDVDPFGFVWAVDGANSKVYKLESDLSAVIAVWGSQGTAIDQMYYPIKLRNALRWVSYDASATWLPERMTQMYLTEMVGQNTGARCFDIVGDVTSHQVSYQNAFKFYDHNLLFIDWYQTGPMHGICEVKYQDSSITYIDSIRAAVNPNQRKEWDLGQTEDVPEGNYIVHVHLQPLLNSSLAQIDFTDTIWVTPVMDTTSGGCRFRAQDARFIVGTSSMYTYNCFLPGTWYRAYLQGVVDRSKNHPVRKKWIAYSGIKLYENNTGAPAHADSLVTMQDTIYFQLPYSLPTGTPQGQVVNMFKVGMRDAISSTPAYRSAQTSALSPDTVANAGCDTLVFRDKLYSSICMSPCGDPVQCQVQGCPWLFQEIEGQYRFLNNLLPQTEIDNPNWQSKVDVYPIYNPSPVDGNLHKFLLTEEEREVSLFDKIEMYAIDIPPDIDSLTLSSGQELIVPQGGPLAPSSAVVNGQIDVLPLVSAPDSLFYESESPGYIDIEYRFNQVPESLSPNTSDGGGNTPPPPKRGGEYKVTANPESDTLGRNYYIVSAQDSLGNYVEVAKIGPRVSDLDNIVPTAQYIRDGALHLRTTWTAAARFDYLPYLSFTKPQFASRKMTMLTGRHSRLGDVKTALSYPADAPVWMEPGDSIEMCWQAPPDSAGMKRVYVITATGKYDRVGSPRLALAKGIPTTYIFEQNYPNPFNPTTTFSYALPTASHVTLAVYNILGQRVTTLVDETKPAGSYRVEWGSENKDGSPVASGVYFAKLTAASFTATKKVMVVR